MRDVTRGFPRILHGNAELTPYSFRYEFPSEPDGQGVEQCVFQVNPDSRPPTNIHVLIGRNGVGKTRLLAGMADSLMDQEAGPIGIRGEFAFDGEEAGAGEFLNLVIVSFSAFDRFDPIPTGGRERTETTLPYFYVGIKADDPEIQATGRVRIKSPEELDAEFGCSMENVSSDPQRLERWLEAMRIVSSDPGIADMGIHGMFLEQVAGAADRMLSAFARMSSGHKIVLLTLTKLVENVSERSLVLIDEPETHLHPPLLGSFIRALSNLLVSRNAVAVVATYSPVVLQEVPASCVSLLMRSGASLMALAMMIAGAMAQADIEPSDGGPAALLVFEFPSAGPWGNEIAGALGGLAEDIATEQGLIWKVWTEASDRGVAGGVYLFEDVQTARVYVAKHSARLAELGVTGIDVREFSVNEPLSIVTRGR